MPVPIEVPVAGLLAGFARQMQPDRPHRREEID
jgi:hypothetical protein